MITLVKTNRSKRLTGDLEGDGYVVDHVAKHGGAAIVSFVLLLADVVDAKNAGVLEEKVTMVHWNSVDSPAVFYLMPL